MQGAVEGKVELARLLCLVQNEQSVSSQIVFHNIQLGNEIVQLPVWNTEQCMAGTTYAPKKSISLK